MAKEKDIEVLEDLPGIGPTTAEKLRGAGVDTLDKIATMSPHELSELSGINVEKAKEAIKAANDAVTLNYQTGDAGYREEEGSGQDQHQLQGLE